MEDRHPIQVVSRRTGLSPHVIRAWERRYGAVSPRRTDSNRRIYSTRDVDRLLLLRRATMAGHKISEVARLSERELHVLVRESRPERLGQRRGADALAPGVGEARFFFQTALEAVGRLDAESLDWLLTGAAVRMSRPDMTEQLLVPLMEEIGEAWRDGRLRIAHEHFATAAVRSFLGSFERSYPAPQSAPGVVVATPAAQIHELGALAVAGTAASEGWRIVYLGASLPADEILAARERTASGAIALSITHPIDDPLLPAELLRLRHGAPGHVALFVGGRSADGYANVLGEIGAAIVPDLSSFRRRLEAHRRELGGRTK